MRGRGGVEEQGPENDHPIEYQLFYLSLRENAVARVQAFVAGHE